MAKPSVLLTISSYRGFGGHEIVINNLCLGLKTIGFRTAIGAFNFIENPPDGIERINLSRVRGLDNQGGDHDFDIVHNHQTLLNYYSLFTKKPFLFHYHGAANRIQEVNLRISMLLCRRKITRIISVSNSGVRKLEDIVGKKVEADVIYNGIDTNKFRTNLPKPHVKGQPQLLFVGVLYPTKNARMLIETMPKILEVYPNAHLQIVGEGTDRASLQELIKHLNLERRIELVGRVSQNELPQRYSSCDIYVSSSFLEALPVPPFEAMGCGKPLLLSDIPAHNEIISASGGGLTFSLAGGQDLINKLQAVYNDRDRFGSNARKFAEKYDWSIVCEKVAEVYEQVMTR